MTRHDQFVVMKTVGIADLKARLSEHLRYVRDGRSITVLDRKTAVAELVPIGHAGPGLSVRPAVGKGGFASVVLPPPLKLRTDPLDLLKLERQSS